MARPARAQWVTRAYARRRHRTWMRSMILATVGWGVWFVHALLGRLESDLQPSVEVTGVLGAAFGVPGLLLAVLTLRAKRSWVLFVSAPLFANACLLLAPLIAGGEGGAN